MPIRIAEGVEPRSEAARSGDDNVLLVGSDASNMLEHELTRYCNREINGRSFLVAGHRGAGKTTLVENVWLRVWKSSEAGKTILRPLFVQLHGPSLFKSAIQQAAVKPPGGADPESEKKKKDAKASQPAKGASAKPGAGKKEGAAAEVAAGAGAGAVESGEAPAAGGEDAKKVEAHSELRIVLEQITLALHRAVVQEFSRGLWRLVEDQRNGMTADDVRELMEVAAQFEVELYQSPETPRLRELYARAGVLESGVLRYRPTPRVGSKDHPRDAADRPPAGARRPPLSVADLLVSDRPRLDLSAFQRQQGARELVALAGISDAYTRLSAKIDETQTDEDQGTEKEARESGLDTAGKDLLTPLYALLSGGLVGVGAGSAAGSWFAGAMSGLIAALGSAVVFKVSSSRSRSRTSVRKTNMVFDRTPTTLDRVIPILIARLIEAGLAPVFVVDELDKVEGLNAKMKEMVHHLKKLVAESAFFCFLTDRYYFEQMSRKRREAAYPVEYTYFTHDLFVVFRAGDFHQYLSRVLEPVALTTGASVDDVDRVDAEVLPFVVLHRAKSHAIDIRRRLVRWRSREGNVSLKQGDIRSHVTYRLDVLLQLAVEVVLDDDAFGKRLLNDPELQRLAHDAMYYITREWIRQREGDDKKGEVLDLEEGEAATREFTTYLASRMRTEGKGAANGAAPNATGEDAEPAPSERTATFLLQRVRELAQLLSSASALASAISKWNRTRVQSERAPVAVSVLNAVTLDYGPAVAAAAGVPATSPPERPVIVSTDPIVLLDRTDTPYRYTWRYDPDGTELVVRLAGTIRSTARVTGTAKAGPKAPGADATTPSEWRKDANYVEAMAKQLADLNR